mmetsp:Transcript_5560/g.11390  ORF Transcript_5560/g.11390 Transcript_5560/m.11390 type:complete len:218 (-) Transcript_5560:78-731(-)
MKTATGIGMPMKAIRMVRATGIGTKTKATTIMTVIGTGGKMKAITMTTARGTGMRPKRKTQWSTRMNKHQVKLPLKRKYNFHQNCPNQRRQRKRQVPFDVNQSNWYPRRTRPARNPQRRRFRREKTNWYPHRSRPVRCLQRHTYQYHLPNRHHRNPSRHAKNSCLHRVLNKTSQPKSNQNRNKPQRMQKRNRSDEFVDWQAVSEVFLVGSVGEMIPR